jgi:folate-binding protein YgfZ
VVRRGALPVAVFTPASPEVVACVLAACGPAVVASDEGWMRARVEHGIPERGVDFDDTNYPQEAALERDAVSFEKGCYLGQEAVFMLEKRGHVKRRLVQLQVDGAVAAGAPIFTEEGAESGRVTSAVERSTKNLALGYVKYKHARSGTALSVGGPRTRQEPRDGHGALGDQARGVTATAAPRAHVGHAATVRGRSRARRTPGAMR